MDKKLIQYHPYVADDGIYVPVYEYQYESDNPLYKLLISKEVVIEAYNRWIKEGGRDEPSTVSKR